MATRFLEWTPVFNNNKALFTIFICLNQVHITCISTQPDNAIVISDQTTQSYIRASMSFWALDRFIFLAKIFIVEAVIDFVCLLVF